MNSLRKLREQIDGIDKKIIRLLNERTKKALEIGKLKSRKKASIYVPDREKEVYRKIVRENRGPVPNEALKTIYREVMSATLTLEKPLKIAYLGPHFTFTHIASLKKFGSQVDYVDCNTITDCFTEVERGRCDYAVVPIENTIEGAITHTMDMFIDSDLKICAEVLLEIQHNLLSKYPLKQVKKIYSKPEVFGQCRLWLESNLPGVELIPVSSTTRGAEVAARVKGSATIAGIQAAKHYKLKVVACSVEESPHNVTRFLVIGKTEAKPTEDDKTSIVFSFRDRAGALHAMLTPFKRSNINLTKIESRPSKKKAWEYYFFVDMTGHYKNPRVKRALTALKKQCLFLKILGSYPKSE